MRHRASLITSIRVDYAPKTETSVYFPVPTPGLQVMNFTRWSLQHSLSHDLRSGVSLVARADDRPGAKPLNLIAFPSSACLALWPAACQPG